jgi:hypothetical protein
MFDKAPVRFPTKTFAQDMRDATCVEIRQEDMDLYIICLNLDCFPDGWRASRIVRSFIELALCILRTQVMKMVASWLRSTPTQAARQRLIDFKSLTDNAISNSALSPAGFIVGGFAFEGVIARRRYRANPQGVEPMDKSRGSHHCDVDAPTVIPSCCTRIFQISIPAQQTAQTKATRRRSGRSKACN